MRMRYATFQQGEDDFDIFAVSGTRTVDGAEMATCRTATYNMPLFIPCFFFPKTAYQRLYVVYLKLTPGSDRC